VSRSHSTGKSSWQLRAPSHGLSMMYTAHTLASTIAERFPGLTGRKFIQQDEQTGLGTYRLPERVPINCESAYLQRTARLKHITCMCLVRQSTQKLLPVPIQRASGGDGIGSHLSGVGAAPRSLPEESSARRALVACTAGRAGARRRV